jgi:TorA maturation chaperone TorD
MDATSLDTVDNPLARAVVYRALALGLQMPTVERLSQTGAGDGFLAVTAALRGLDPEHHDPALTHAAARLAALPPPDPASAVASYVRLFGHTARGLVCACETEYGPDNGFHQPQQLADIAGCYLAFGLSPASTSEVRVDHIACECEFMDFLNRKEAVLLAGAGQDLHAQETLEVTHEAGRSFLRDHLARFGCAIATRLAKEDEGGHFGALGELMLAFLHAEAARLGIQTGPTELSVRTEFADDGPIGCASANDLIQIEPES